MSEITIARRFRGPEDSGNGGYTCGMVARFIEGDAEITLRKPPPLDLALEVRPIAGGVDVYDGDDLIAEGRSATLELFVCGTDRADDGLMVHAGQVEGREVWAAPFIPDPSLPAVDGVLAPEMVWSALDCPGAWAVERATQDRPVVLGRMTARLERDAPADRDYVAIGWPIGVDGRKLFSGTALFDGDGNLYGSASQTWFVLA